MSREDRGGEGRGVCRRGRLWRRDGSAVGGSWRGAGCERQVSSGRKMTGDGDGGGFGDGDDGGAAAAAAAA